jgi:hypothetical protein
MNRTYKLIASRGAEVIFDDRIDALTPRAVRRTRKSGQGRAKLSYGWQVRERVG